MPDLRRLLPALVLFATGASAHACTVCDSQNGHALRAGLFNGHFLQTLFVVLAPIPVLVAAVVSLHFGMPDLRSSEETAAEVLPLAEPEVLA